MTPVGDTDERGHAWTSTSYLGLSFSYDQHILNFNIAGEISRSASGQVIYITGEVQYMGCSLYLKLVIDQPKLPTTTKQLV